MCYVGKATKIFIFIVTVVVVFGIVLGFGFIRHSILKNHKCEGDDCHSVPSPDFRSPNQNPGPAFSGSTQPTSPPSRPATNLTPPSSDESNLTPPPPSSNSSSPPPDFNPTPPPPPPPFPQPTTPPPASSASPPVGSATNSMPVTPGPVHAQTQPAV